MTRIREQARRSLTTDLTKHGSRALGAVAAPVAHDGETGVSGGM